MSNLNTGRIAKNTLMLYFRMLLIMAVSLYTSRVVLEVLGVQDYGIYSLIAGLLTMFSFISQSLVESMQRFFNVALGKNDIPQTSSIYVMGINIFVIFSLFLFLLLLKALSSVREKLLYTYININSMYNVHIFRKRMNF